jgi:hypothetical protein
LTAIGFLITCGGCIECGKHGDSCRFPGAVGAEQAEYLPFFDVEGDSLDRGEVAVFFDEMIYFEDR